MQSSALRVATCINIVAAWLSSLTPTHATMAPQNPIGESAPKKSLSSYDNSSPSHDSKLSLSTATNEATILVTEYTNDLHAAAACNIRTHTRQSGQDSQPRSSATSAILSHTMESRYPFGIDGLPVSEALHRLAMAAIVTEHIPSGTARPVLSSQSRG